MAHPAAAAAATTSSHSNIIHHCVVVSVQEKKLTKQITGEVITLDTSLDEMEGIISKDHAAMQVRRTSSFSGAPNFFNSPFHPNNADVQSDSMKQELDQVQGQQTLHGLTRVVANSATPAAFTGIGISAALVSAVNAPESWGVNPVDGEDSADTDADKSEQEEDGLVLSDFYPPHPDSHGGPSDLPGAPPGAGRYAASSQSNGSFSGVSGMTVFSQTGECNIQYALNPFSKEYTFIEVNAHLSRSSALASKATGYPLAFIAAKLGLGEAMAIGRNIEEAIQKAIRSVDPAFIGFDKNSIVSQDQLEQELSQPTDRRIFAIANAFNEGWSLDEVWEISRINKWFLSKLKHLVTMEKIVKRYHASNFPVNLLRYTKQLGFSDHELKRVGNS
ncbi:carbamoyl-phosphate synthase small subunit [Puccinia sorghi]|uniref:Carbamoyl-phosphate synthase small subunit n=1 Tax=Puccinia sorghi TaxID=27349 RepID=A0A0L6UCL0_9BASI|nr:carbamoyl-phosphate synthase small subunit [Puccinia sorghi]